MDEQSPPVLFSFHLNHIYHDQHRVPEESALSQPTALGSCAHNTQKKLVLWVCFNGCVHRWEVNHLWAPLSQKKTGINEEPQSPPNLHFPGGCQVNKLNITQRSTNQRSIYTNIIPKVCFHAYLDLQ